MSQKIQEIRAISSINYTEIHNSFFVFRPHVLRRAADCFLKNFPGTILYAVKTNPESYVLDELYSCGVRNFDVASLAEIKIVHTKFPDANLFFMHPVKPRQSIRDAYNKYGVRTFSLDNEDELNKILEETNNAKDLTLHLRISIPNSYAELNLAEKFGINLQAGPELLRKIAGKADQVGVCFHSGSQCMHPDAYKIAMRMAAEVIEKAQVKINYFNVGGGFPSIYPGMIPPDMMQYFATIKNEFAKINKDNSIQLICEPGRALVAESKSLIVRVDLRKDNILYINDGTYGSLFDAGTPKFIFPVKLLDNNNQSSSNLIPFSFYGPTCDSLDFMKGPFYLPKNITEGDYIEIGQMGAYGKTMATSFNGFKPEDEVIYVSDEPLMTMYGGGLSTYSYNNKLEIIAA